MSLLQQLRPSGKALEKEEGDDDAMEVRTHTHTHRLTIWCINSCPLNYYALSQQLSPFQVTSLLAAGEGRSAQQPNLFNLQDLVTAINSLEAQKRRRFSVEASTRLRRLERQRQKSAAPAATVTFGSSSKDTEVYNNHY